MVRKAFVGFMGSFLLIAALTGCAGLPGKGTVATGPSPAEVKLIEANKALDAVNEQSSNFYAQLNSLTKEIAEFRSRPYWGEFELILLEFPSLRDPDNETEITPEIGNRLAEWSRKWKTSWEQTLEDYLRRVDKSTILEAKILAAQARLNIVKAKYIEVVVMEARAGHEKQGREILGVVEALEKTGAELDTYRPDDLGLYNSR